MLFSPVFVTSDPRPLFSAKPLRSWPLRVRSSLNPLECAVLDKHLVLPCFSRIRAHATPLECALARALIHKSFRMRSSEKSGGLGSKLLTRNRMNGPARQIARACHHNSAQCTGSPIYSEDPESWLSTCFSPATNHESTACLDLVGVTGSSVQCGDFLPFLPPPMQVVHRDV